MPPSTIEFTESHVHSALDQPEVPFSRRVGCLFFKYKVLWIIDYFSIFYFLFGSRSKEDKVNPWEKCTELASDFDNKYCDTLKDELDNLLVFVSLLLERRARCADEV